ncbi:MAG: hypothetical protein AAB019_10005 [Planctomycetota bacterium]
MILKKTHRNNTPFDLNTIMRPLAAKEPFMKNKKWEYLILNLVIIFTLLFLKGIIWAGNDPKINKEKNHPVKESEKPDKDSAKSKEPEKPDHRDDNHDNKSEITRPTNDTAVEPSAKNKPDKWDDALHGKGDNRDDEHSGKVDIVGDGNSGNNGQKLTDQQTNSPIDLQSNSPTVQMEIPESVKSEHQRGFPLNPDEERGPDQITPGSDNGKGDNRDDEHSGKIDRVADGNSGQKPSDKPESPERPPALVEKPLPTVSQPAPSLPPEEGGYELAKVAKATFESEEKFEGVKGPTDPDPSIINLKLSFEPVNYNRTTDCFQMKVTIESVKVKHMDERSHFTYDYNNVMHRREAWNRLYKSVSDAEDFRKNNNNNNLPRFYGYSRGFFDEMLKTLACVTLPKRSFMVEISRFGDTIKPIGLDQTLSEGFQSLPPVSEVNHLKQMLTEHITQTLRLIFPKIPRSASDRLEPGTVLEKNETTMRYSYHEQQKDAHRKQKKVDKEFYYSLAHGLIISHETVEDSSSIDFVAQNGRTGPVTPWLEWERTKHKISLVKLDKK